jgi:hypothetical protein
LNFKSLLTEKTLADPQRNISGNAGDFTGCFGEVKYSFRNSEESFQIDSNCEIALVSKSMTAVLASDWQNHFRHLLQNNL